MLKIADSKVSHLDCTGDFRRAIARSSWDPGRAGTPEGLQRPPARSVPLARFARRGRAVLPGRASREGPFLRGGRRDRAPQSLRARAPEASASPRRPCGQGPAPGTLGRQRTTRGEPGTPSALCEVAARLLGLARKAGAGPEGGAPLRATRKPPPGATCLRIAAELAKGRKRLVRRSAWPARGKRGASSWCSSILTACTFVTSEKSSSSLLPNLLMSENRVEEKMKLLFLLAFVLLFPQSKGNPLSRDDDGYQRTFEDLKKEIAGYSDIAKKIIDLAVYGRAQNRSYERLALFVDTIGPRLSGSKNLDLAIKYMYKALRMDGLENVHLEPVKIPHWVRGKESALMVEPRNHSIAILGLGGSVATPPEGITAEVLVVASFDELHQRAEEAQGKIIVYNQPYVSYGETVQYRGRGAVEAAKVGAKASLIKTVAPFSINSPHTGMQSYQPGVRKIPTACISVEDAELMARFSSRGNKIVLTLKMEAKTYPDADSFNTVAEIVGRKYPEQVVLVSGHLDSWDVGQGAMDDGGGAFVSWEALSLLKDLGLRPKRTLRLVLWTGEEQGGVGAEQYYKMHKLNLSNFDIVMESDEGTFKPTGLAFTGSDKARNIMKEIMKLLQPINVTSVFGNGGGTDINYWIRDGIPGASLQDDVTRYFWFHHSQGDTMTVQDPAQMNLCAALWTVVSYVIADMEERVPV